jgi:asparagine synthase (glutamine-hydrolysing)
LKHSRFLSKHFPSESLFHVAGRTRAEWTGLSVLSYSDTKKIFPDAFDVSAYWLAKDTKQDYLDFRPAVRGTIIDQEIFTRKVRNFSDSIGGNMILPWANQRVAEYFFKMPEQYLFDRKTLKNKLVLRKILKDRIGLDSDSLGKLGFSYDTRAIVLQNWDWMLQEMQQCTLWNKTDLVKVVTRMKNRMNGTGWGSGAAGRLISKIYLLSAWHNRCR